MSANALSALRVLQHQPGSWIGDRCIKATLPSSTPYNAVSELRAVGCRIDARIETEEMKQLTSYRLMSRAENKK